jgi:hypothetical protein
VCASVVVMLDTPCSEVVWRVLPTHSIRQFPLHFPSLGSPCAITFQMDSTGLLFEGKAAGCEVDLSPPSNTEVKNEWSYRFSPPNAFMARQGKLYLLRGINGRLPHWRVINKRDRLMVMVGLI